MLKSMCIVVTTASLIFLSACSSNSSPGPTPVPSVDSSPSAIVSEASTLPTSPVATPDESRTEEPTKAPLPTITTNEAGTPAVQFAQRWGKRYPQVPEFAILKSANTVCDILEQAPAEWHNDSTTMQEIANAATRYAMNASDALEFAQDADQNYCASVANPT